MRRHPEPVRAQAFTLRSRGWPIRRIAVALGVPYRTVGTWLQGHGDATTVRTCALCGDRFFSTSATHRYCSATHRRKHARLRPVMAT